MASPCGPGSLEVVEPEDAHEVPAQRRDVDRVARLHPHAPQNETRIDVPGSRHADLGDAPRLGGAHAPRFDVGLPAGVVERVAGQLLASRQCGPAPALDRLGGRGEVRGRDVLEVRREDEVRGGQGRLGVLPGQERRGLAQHAEGGAQILAGDERRADVHGDDHVDPLLPHDVHR